MSGHVHFVASRFDRRYAGSCVGKTMAAFNPLLFPEGPMTTPEEAAYDANMQWVPCPGCAGEIGVPPHWLANTVACPKCGAIVSISEIERVLWRPPKGTRPKQTRRSGASGAPSTQQGQQHSLGLIPVGFLILAAFVALVAFLAAKPTAFGLGHIETLVLGVVVLLLFRNRLPSLMWSLGRSVAELKQASRETEEQKDESPKAPTNA